MQQQVNTIDDGFRHSFKEFNKEQRTIKHYISSSDANRYGQILPVEGFDETNFRTNNVVLFQHGMNATDITTTPAKEQLDFLIGKNRWFSKSTNHLMAETQFLPEGKSKLADDVYTLNIEGFMNAWSKHWYSIPNNDAIQYNKDGTMTISKWGIYEYSSVFVPVDTGAVNDLSMTKNMLSVVKSDTMKNFLSQNTIEKTIDVNLNELIKPLQDEINSIKEFNKNLKSEISKDIFDSIKQYNKKLSETIPGIVGDQILNSFNKIGITNLENVIENKVAGAIRKVTGII